jgi:outer membrane protease
MPLSAWGLIAPTTGAHLWQARGQRFHLSIGTSVVGQNGDMTYTIRGAENGGWQSELEWPIESVVYAGGNITTTAWERVHLNVAGWKSLNEDAGIMKDRDWFDDLRALLLTLYGTDVAIYGEFDATIDAAKFDTNLRFDLLRGSPFALGALAGYAYTHFEWVTGDGFQRSPLPNFNVGSVNGPGILYEQTLQVPYLGLAMSLVSDTTPLGLNAYALYSPLALCEDVDDHLVRFKKSTGRTQGTFFSLGGDVVIRFSRSWRLTGSANYAHYELEGEQDQEFYGGENIGTRFYDLDMTVDGSQMSVGFLLSYTVY